jgi:predicted  nucleic acid-binding Zn-ribbon protein
VSRSGDLLRLQEIDARLAHDSTRLRDAEAEIAGDPELERRRRDARLVRRRQAGADADLAVAEKQVDDLRRRARELDRHLYGGSVRNPQELLVMQHELAALRARITTEDDRLLELMQQAESAAGAERDANAAVVDLEQERADRAGELLERVAALRTAIGQHQRERADVVAALTPADASLYERLSRRLQPAVVRVVGDSCGGCHIPFANSEVRRIRLADEPAQCPGCDRIVVS